MIMKVIRWPVSCCFLQNVFCLSMLSPFLLKSATGTVRKQLATVPFPLFTALQNQKCWDIQCWFYIVLLSLQENFCTVLSLVRAGGILWLFFFLLYQQAR